MFDTYKPSGRLGSLAIPWLVVGMLVAIALAFVYHQALYWIPLIYVNFLATAGMGIGVGMIAVFVVNAGKVRNPLLAIVFGLLIGAAGLSAKYYWQYRAMISDEVAYGMDEMEGMEDFDESKRGELRQTLRRLIADNVSFVDHLKIRVDQGWEIGRGGGGAPVKGLFVYLIWLIEAGIIFYYAVTMPRGAAMEPFSEKIGEWASEEEQVMTLPITDQEMVSTIQTASSVDDLLNLPIPKSDESNQFAVYRVHSIPGQEMEDAYLSVDLLTLSINKKGEQETATSPLVKYAILPTEKREQLKENASLMQEAFDAYRQAVEADALEADALAEGESENGAEA